MLTTILLCASTLSFADGSAEAGMLAPHNPAPQSFQQAISLPSNTTTPTVANAINTATPLTIKTSDIMLPANNVVLTHQLHLLIHAFKVEKQNNEQAINDLNQKVATTGQVALDFQQKTAEQLVELTQANQELKQQIHSLVGIMQTLNAEIAKTTSSNRMTIWLLSLSAFDFILFILVLITLSSRKKNTGSTTRKSLPSEEDEYDFLGSKEGVNTRLDLARVYFEMDHFAEAEEILKTVLKDGNDEQKAEAKKLLAELVR